MTENNHLAFNPYPDPYFVIAAPIIQDCQIGSFLSSQ